MSEYLRIKPLTDRESQVLYLYSYFISDHCLCWQNKRNGENISLNPPSILWSLSQTLSDRRTSLWQRPLCAARASWTCVLSGTAQSCSWSWTLPRRTPSRLKIRPLGTLRIFYHTCHIVTSFLSGITWRRELEDFLFRPTQKISASWIFLVIPAPLVYMRPKPEPRL